MTTEPFDLGMLHVNPSLGRYAAVIKTWRAEVHRLPMTVENGLIRLNALHQQVLKIPAQAPADTTSLWVANVVEAGLSGAEPPTLEDLESAYATAERAMRGREVLFAAVQSLAARLAVAVETNADAIFDDYVHPAFVDLFREVAEVNAALGSLRAGEQVIRGSEEQRDAWVRLPGLNSRYSLLREAGLALDWAPGGMSRNGRNQELPNLARDIDLVDLACPVATSEDQSVVDAYAASSAE